LDTGFHAKILARKKVFRLTRRRALLQRLALRCVHDIYGVRYQVMMKVYMPRVPIRVVVLLPLL
jgi:hypothetical protein